MQVGRSDLQICVCQIITDGRTPLEGVKGAGLVSLAHNLARGLSEHGTVVDETMKVEGLGLPEEHNEFTSALGCFVVRCDCTFGRVFDWYIRFSKVIINFAKAALK